MDIQRYLGDWYEIAKYPFPMERDCVFATAKYSLEDDKMIIENTCLDKNRKSKRKSFGKARKVGEFHFKVKFSGPDAWPNEGDYIVLYTDYDNYAFVGGGPFFWILARTPQVSKKQLLFLLSKVKQLGYNPNKVITNPNNFF